MDTLSGEQKKSPHPAAYISHAPWTRPTFIYGDLTAVPPEHVRPLFPRMVLPYLNLLLSITFAVTDDHDGSIMVHVTFAEPRNAVGYWRSVGDREAEKDIR